MPFIATIKLSFGNNLIVSNLPDEAKLEGLSKRITILKEPIENYGLFDSNTANYNTYYPDVTEEDLKPKDEDFIQPVFRALSEVIVNPQYNPVDFSMHGALKKSMSLLLGQTINVDHETAVGNAIGAIAGNYWEDGYKSKNGVLVPSGINSKLKIDGKSHPRIARAIMMDPPAIHSTSVTVQFEWEKSHEISAEDFYNKLGTYDKDGKLIRRVVTAVRRYFEISLVSHGADPFAQKIKENGEINNPRDAKAAVKMSSTEKKEQKLFLFDFKTDVIQNKEKVSIPLESNNIPSTPNNKNMKEFLVQLAALLGITTLSKEEEPTEADKAAITSGISKLMTDKANLQTTADKLPTVQTALDTATTKLEGFKDVEGIKKFKEDMTTSLRKKVLANYNKLNPKPLEAITKMIEGATFETLEAFGMQLELQLDEKYPLKCADCGGKVTRASAKQKEEEDDEDGDLGRGKKKHSNKVQEGYADAHRRKLSKKSAIAIHGKVDHDDEDGE